MLTTDPYDIVLGSQSPRRKELLQQLNIPFRQEVKPIDEQYPDNIRIEDIAIYLAQKKGEVFMDNIDNQTLVITADTIVSNDHKVLEKPKDAQHAFDMLKSLSGGIHEVYSGVAITSTSGQTCFYDTTKVHFRALEDEEINYYIDTCQPYDKAGAYGIQEWIGHIGVEKIEGSFYTVMGLPIHQLYSALRQILK